MPTARIRIASPTRPHRLEQSGSTYKIAPTGRWTARDGSRDGSHSWVRGGNRESLSISPARKLWGGGNGAWREVRRSPTPPPTGGRRPRPRLRTARGRRTRSSPRPPAGNECGAAAELHRSLESYSQDRAVGLHVNCPTLPAIAGSANATHSPRTSAKLSGVLASRRCLLRHTVHFR